MGKTSSGTKYVVGGTIGCFILLFGCCAGCVGMLWIAAPKLPKHATREAVMDHFGAIQDAVQKRLDDDASLDHRQWKAPDALLAVFEMDQEHEFPDRKDRDLLQAHDVRITFSSASGGLGAGNALIDGREGKILIIEFDRNGKTYRMALRDWAPNEP